MNFDVESIRMLSGYGCYICGDRISVCVVRCVVVVVVVVVVRVNWQFINHSLKRV